MATYQGDSLTIEDAAGNQRVVLGKIKSNPDDYGLVVQSSDGSTTIIDGTSDIFKIVATGTITIPALGGGGATNGSVTIATGLTYSPATLWYWNSSGSRLSLAWTNLGATWTLYGTSTDLGGGSTQLVGNMGAAAAQASQNVRYYVFSEVAI